MRVGLGRKARNDVRAEGDAGTQLSRLFAKGDGVVAQMPPFHPLEDQVVAVLKAQVQMRHKARLGGDGEHQVLVRLDGIDGRDAQAVQVRHQPQNPHDQIAKTRLARQIGTP